MNWTITLLADNRTIEIYESTTGILSMYPIDTFVVSHEIEDVINKYLILDGADNNFFYKINVADISNPPIGLNMYQQYLQKLARRLNGDSTVVF